MFKKVAFTMYPVKDPQRARSFYEGTLSLTVGSHSPNGVWTEYNLPGGGCLALFATQDIEPSAGSGLASCGFGSAPAWGGRNGRSFAPGANMVGEKRFAS